MSDNIVDLGPKTVNNSKSDVSMNNKKKQDMSEKSIYDVRSISLPIATLIGVISFFVWITWEGAQVNTKIEKLGENVSMLSKTVETVVQAIDPLKRGPTWTVQDQTVWCLRTQIANPNWKCPEAYTSAPATRIIVPPPME